MSTFVLLITVEQERNRQTFSIEDGGASTAYHEHPFEPTSQTIIVSRSPRTQGYGKRLIRWASSFNASGPIPRPASRLIFFFFDFAIRNVI